jgi:hypothetical protein
MFKGARCIFYEMRINEILKFLWREFSRHFVPRNVEHERRNEESERANTELNREMWHNKKTTTFDVFEGGSSHRESFSLSYRMRVHKTTVSWSFFFTNLFDLEYCNPWQTVFKRHDKIETAINGK